MFFKGFHFFLVNRHIEGSIRLKIIAYLRTLHMQKWFKRCVGWSMLDSPRTLLPTQSLPRFLKEKFLEDMEIDHYNVLLEISKNEFISSRVYFCIPGNG